MKSDKQRIKVDRLKPKAAKDQEKIKGGKTPTPGGPIPIPYPNTSTTK